jgi:anthranilate/para-aminobenzoate synthase component II
MFQISPIDASRKLQLLWWAWTQMLVMRLQRTNKFETCLWLWSAVIMMSGPPGESRSAPRLAEVYHCLAMISSACNKLLLIQTWLGHESSALSYGSSLSLCRGPFCGSQTPETSLLQGVWGPPRLHSSRLPPSAALLESWKHVPP